MVIFPLSFSGVGSRVHLRQKLQSKNTGAVLDTAETMAFDASQAAQDFVGPDHYPDLDRSKTNDSLRRCLVQDFGVQEVEQFSGTEGQASFDKIFKCAISISAFVPISKIWATTVPPSVRSEVLKFGLECISSIMI